MPRFSLTDPEILSVVAFVHSQQDKAMSQTGVRKGVEDSDLTTGNAEAGKLYFDGKGGCVSCHSATGDMKGIASRYTGLRLEEQMLYPRDAKAKITVKTRTGETLTGTVEYKDEFTIGMKDSFGTYHSWPVSAVTYKIDEPADAHVTAMSKYSDDDIHNVLAYMQTLK
jgi:cytochrome c oxidase cbb3-type subunit 3